MLKRFSQILFGSKYERDIKALKPLVEAVNNYAEEMSGLTDDQLKEKTQEFKTRLQQDETIDDLLPEAFAVVREAADRTLGMRHFDVQIMGGISLHYGRIAEMKTGEGKTLVATLPVYLNALTGKGVHVVTVNDYLARRDKEWMAPVYEFLGMTIGVINQGMSHDERRVAYACDITYGTNNEMGFDYLRDNMVVDKSQKVQRGFNFCIVDEVDSILIDEARTPLIISGPTGENNEEYYRIDRYIPKLRISERGDDGKWIEGSGDYIMDEKDRYCALTENGISKMEKFMNIENLYSDEHVDLVHKINNSLKAHVLFKRDKDYIVDLNPDSGKAEVIIIDEHTGRKMYGRRYSDGLHQALEAKEKVTIAADTQTYATITFQNYFRMYSKLAGMTGTAETEAVEFKKIYGLDVVVIPTNEPVRRLDFSDRIYRSEREKFNSIAEEIRECHQAGQPVLVGTISVEKSERLSKLLKKKGIPHNVLNAKNHEREALIIAQAGQQGSVTIATNMAGRGTDIKLGEGVVEAGGLHIIGSERHESRRIDNQLRGRSGRQGDPGSSRFYLSLQDDLLRLFGSERMGGMMARMGLEEGQEIEHPWVSKAIERAQQKVESRNFDIRKHLLEYDDVMNQQRKFIYEFRDKILYNDNLLDDVLQMIESVAVGEIDYMTDSRKSITSEEAQLVLTSIYEITGVTIPIEEGRPHYDTADFEKMVIEELIKYYRMKEQEYSEAAMRRAERIVMLQIIDGKWKQHLYNMDSLKEGISWRSFAQKDPLVEYKREGGYMFEEMRATLRRDIIYSLFRIRIRMAPSQQEKKEMPKTAFSAAKAQSQKQEVGQFGGSGDGQKQTQDNMGGASVPRGAQQYNRRIRRKIAKQQPSDKGTTTMPKAVERQQIVSEKVGRNELCPCGSGKKFKHCCGRE